MQKTGELYASYLTGNLNNNTETKKYFPNFLHELSYENRVILDSPIIVGLIITEECNLHCPHCFSRFKKGAPNINNLKSIIDQLAEKNVISLYITGGEPFMYPDIMELITYIKSKRMFLTIHTNGVMLNNTIINELSTLLTDTDIIQISIDGVKKETNKKMRTLSEQQFNKIKENCLILSEFNIKVKINVTVTNHNLYELKDLYLLASELNIKYISFSSLFITDLQSNFTTPPMNLELINEFEKVLNLAINLNFPVQIVQDPIAVPCGNKLLMNTLLNEFNVEEIPYYNCPAGTTAIEIDYHGETYPCPFLRNKNFSAGNVFKDSLSKIWNNGETWGALRRRIREGYQSNSECQFSSFCRGACPAQALIAGGTLDDCDLRCELNERGVVFYES